MHQEEDSLEDDTKNMPINGKNGSESDGEDLSKSKTKAKKNESESEEEKK